MAAARSTNTTARIEEFHAQVWTMWSSLDADGDGNIRRAELQDALDKAARTADRPAVG